MPLPKADTWLFANPLAEKSSGFLETSPLTTVADIASNCLVQFLTDNRFKHARRGRIWFDSTRTNLRYSLDVYLRIYCLANRLGRESQLRLGGSVQSFDVMVAALAGVPVLPFKGVNDIEHA